jgi:hypothetical protein
MPVLGGQSVRAGGAARSMPSPSPMSHATAAAIWRELLAGEWVVLDRRDGTCERTLVLRRATAAERRAHALGEVERDVITMAMRAWSLKMMGAELGLSTSRVAEILGRIRAKLGAPTHADLLRMVGSFGASSDDGASSVMVGPADVPSTREKSLQNRKVAV